MGDTTRKWLRAKFGFSTKVPQVEPSWTYVTFGLCSILFNHWRQATSCWGHLDPLSDREHMESCSFQSRGELCKRNIDSALFVSVAKDAPPRPIIKMNSTSGRNAGSCDYELWQGPWSARLRTFVSWPQLVGALGTRVARNSIRNRSGI